MMRLKSQNYDIIAQNYEIYSQNDEIKTSKLDRVIIMR